MGKFSTRDIIIEVSTKTKTLTFKDLHIKCEIIKSISGTPNIATVTIFNLNRNSRAFLNNVFSDDGMSLYTSKIILDDVEMFKGDLVTPRSFFNMGTWTTELFLNDGYNSYLKNATVETKKGDTRGQIFEMLVDTLRDTGLNDFDIQALRNRCGNKSILKRILYDGNVMENIKKLISDCIPESEVYIDEGKLSVLDKNSSKPTLTTLTEFLSPPELNEQGCRATTLLNNEPKLGQEITLQAKSYNQSFGNLSTNRPTKSRFLGEGVYKVIEIMHEFDNYTENVAKSHFTGVYLR